MKLNKSKENITVIRRDKKKIKEKYMEKNKELWTYCYSINPNAEDFVKTIYENTKIDLGEQKKTVVNYIKKKKSSGIDKINIIDIHNETEIPIIYLNIIYDELIEEKILTEEK